MEVARREDLGFFFAKVLMWGWSWFFVFSNILFGKEKYSDPNDRLYTFYLARELDGTQRTNTTKADPRLAFVWDELVGFAVCCAL